MARFDPRRISRVWRDVTPYIGASGPRLAAIAGISLLRGLAEAGVLVLIRTDRPGARRGPIRSPHLPRTGGVRTGPRSSRRSDWRSRWCWPCWCSTSPRPTSAPGWPPMRSGPCASVWRPCSSGPPGRVQAEERQGRLQEVMTTFGAPTSCTAPQVVNFVVALCNLGALLVAALVHSRRAHLVGRGIGRCPPSRPLTRLTRRQSRANQATNAAFATEVTEIVSVAQEVKIHGVGEAVLGSNASIRCRCLDHHGSGAVPLELGDRHIPGTAGRSSSLDWRWSTSPAQPARGRPGRHRPPPDPGARLRAGDPEFNQRAQRGRFTRGRAGPGSRLPGGGRGQRRAAGAGTADAGVSRRFLSTYHGVGRGAPGRLARARRRPGHWDRGSFRQRQVELGRSSSGSVTRRRGRYLDQRRPRTGLPARRLVCPTRPGAPNPRVVGGLGHRQRPLLPGPRRRRAGRASGARRPPPRGDRRPPPMATTLSCTGWAAPLRWPGPASLLGPGARGQPHARLPRRAHQRAGRPPRHWSSRRLGEIKGQVTVVIIAHRMSTLRLCGSHRRAGERHATGVRHP